MTVSRRGLLGLGAAAVATVIAGCARGVRTISAPTTSGPARSATSARSSAATSTTPTARASAPRHGSAVQHTTGPRTRPEVALTFHGAGDPAIARQLLDVFRAHDAKVTVLGVGSWLAANPGVAREIAAAGHELGNHTYNHLDINSLAASAASDEIVRCRDVLTSIVGSGGAVFRQSQAATATPLVLRLAGAAGYPICLSYDIDSLDYTDPGADAVRTNVATAQPGSIVSMHFGHIGTVEAMPLVLADLAARGLRAVTASTLLRR